MGLPGGKKSREDFNIFEEVEGLVELGYLGEDLGHGSHKRDVD